MERHRADPVCASCHAVMDPLGFGLESYDAVGAFRTEDNGFPIDDSGELPDGTTFDGAIELGAILNQDTRFNQCVTKKALAYALGRAITPSDRCYVADIIERAADRDLSLRELIIQIALSEVFTHVGGQLEEAP
jgi:hypothetical protein